MFRKRKWEALAPVRRVDEGCARALVGEGEGANGIKGHRALAKRLLAPA